MNLVKDIQHSERMKKLVEYTSSSLETEFPSPFGSVVYKLQNGVLLSQAYDTVMEKCDPTNHAEINAIRKATQKLQRLSLGLYSLQHLRTLPDVYVCLYLGRVKGCCIWCIDNGRCKYLLASGI